MKKFIPFSILFLCAFLIQANPVDASSNVFSKLLLDETVVSAEMMNISINLQYSNTFHKSILLFVLDSEAASTTNANKLVAPCIMMANICTTDRWTNAVR